MCDKTTEQVRYEHLESNLDICDKHISLITKTEIIEEMLVLKQALGCNLLFLSQTEKNNPSGGKPLALAS